MGYDLCLFDLDGTLTDPKIGITRSFQYALSYFGIVEETENLTRFIGPPLRESFSEYSLSTSEISIAVEKYREYFARTGIFENTLYDGIPELLNRLVDYEIILGVATNKPTIYARRILEHFMLDSYFSFVSGDELDGSNTTMGKRDIISIALDNLDMTRSLVAVMIGDRKNDILGAADTRIDSIGITWGYGSIDELKEAGATQIATSVTELYSMITGGARD